MQKVPQFSGFLWNFQTKLWNFSMLQYLFYLPHRSNKDGGTLAECPVLGLQLLDACRLLAAQGDQPEVSVGGTEQGFGGLVASGLLHHGTYCLVVFGGQVADKNVLDGFHLC